MLIVDKLAYASKIREKSPVVKVAFAITTLLACISINSIIMSTLIMIMMGYLTVKYSQISLSGYIKMLSFPAAFLILSTIAILFDFSTAKGDLWNLFLGSIYISVSKVDLLHTAKLIFVALSSVSSLYFMSLTTPMVDIIYVMRKVRIPKLLVELTLLIYRFMFILLEMADNITISQRSRLSNTNFKSRMKSISMLLSVILIRALNKANLMYNAMESRCYDGNIRVLWEHEKTPRKDFVKYLLYLFVVIAIGVFIRWRGYI